MGRPWWRQPQKFGNLACRVEWSDILGTLQGLWGHGRLIISATSASGLVDGALGCISPRGCRTAHSKWKMIRDRFEMLGETSNGDLMAE